MLVLEVFVGFYILVICTRISDSEDKTLVILKGLNLVNLTASPHHIRESHRDSGLVKLMQNTPGVAIALDDNCAIEIVDGNYRLLTSKEGVGAKKVYYSKGQPHSERISVVNSYTPISELTKKS